ncbi:MAG: hypothetical protein U1F42_03935 [Candidatus Competibacteraceae bacterium]
MQTFTTGSPLSGLSGVVSVIVALAGRITSAPDPAEQPPTAVSVLAAVMASCKVQ